MKTMLPRRTLLRGLFHGAAVTVALPRLEAMLNGNGTAWAQGGALPKFFGVWAKANGVHFPRFYPTEVGKGYTLKEQIVPLGPVRDWFSIISGMDLPRIGANPGRGHSAMNTILATGKGMTGGDQTYTAAGPSIDQLVAASIAGNTPRKSIHLGTAGGPPPEPGTAFHWWSHNGPNSPNVCNYSCADVFNLLFTGAKPATPSTPQQPAVDTIEINLKTRQSILDVVKADADDLLKQVGTTDKQRIQQHLEGIFAIEKRLKGATTDGMNAGVGLPAGASCMTPASPAIALTGGTSNDYDTNVRMINKTMAQLLALALACDITRVFTFETMQPGSRVNVRTITGRDGAYHGLSHGNAGDENCHKVNTFMMDELRVFIETLRDTKDGAGSLLDRGAILASDCTNQGPDHGLNNFPMLIIGKAGGLRTGEHIKFPAGSNALAVPFTVARAAGATLPSFGTGQFEVRQPLSQLLV